MVWGHLTVAGKVGAKATLYNDLFPPQLLTYLIILPTMGMVTQRTQLSTVVSPYYTTFLLSSHSWPCTPILRSVLENRFGDNERPAPHLDSLSCPATCPGWTPFPFNSLALLPAGHKVPLPIGPEVLGLRPPHSGLPIGQGRRLQ